MAKFAGKDLLLYSGNGASPETFTLIAGLRSTGATVNNEQIDVTDKDDSRWRKLIEGGVRSMSLSAAGLFQDVTVHQTLLTRVSNGTINNYRITFAGGMSFTGAFQVASLELSGEYTDAQQYSITLESADDITVDTTP